MAQAVDQDEQVARFRREVLPRLVEVFRPTAVILFGSRVRGDALKDSDLDVLVVSEAFRDVPWVDRPVRVAQACDVRMPLEVLCYTPKEYARKREELGIVRNAMEEGYPLVGSR